MANVPEIRVEFDPTGSPSTASPEWRDLSTYARLTDGISWSSGRQDETASIQAGVMSVNLNNDGGVFTPGSGECVTAWGVDLRIRVPIRLRARYGGGSSAYGSGLYGVGSYSPTISGNLLSAEDASFEAGTVGTWAAGGTVPPTLSNSTAHPQVGTKGLLITWGTGGTLPLAGVTVTGLVIGRYYTASAYVYVPSGSPDPQLAIAGSTLGASTATKNALERISVTWQAAASSETLQVWPATSPTAGQTCYVDAVQVDEGTTVGDFTTAAPPVYDIWSGFVDSWDGGWTGGRRPITHVRASDRVARLSRKSLRATLDSVVLADSPNGYWPLTEAADAATAGNLAPVATAPTLTQYQQGSGGTVAFGATGPSVEGTTAVAFTPSTLTNGLSLGGAYMSGVTTTTTATLEAWVNTSTAAVQYIAADSGSGLSLQVTAASKLLASWSYPYPAASASVTSASNVTGGWKHVAVTLSISGGTATVKGYINGVSVGSSSTAFAASVYTTAFLEVGGLANAAGGALLTGSVASVAVYPTELAAATLLAHYNAGASAFSGDTTDARFDRICAYAEIPSTLYSSPEAGLTTMGVQPLAGKSAFSALTECADAERGVAFSSPAGVVTFHSRSHRYNATSSFTLLGSDVEPGLVFTTDDQNLINDATVARYGGGTQRFVNADSADKYDTYDVSLSLYTSDDTFTASLAQYLVNTYGEPSARSSAVEVDLYSKAATAPVTSILAATIGTRFTMDSLPDSSSAPSTSVDLFVEGVSGSVNDREWKWRANTSPVNASAVWSLDSTSYSQLDTTTILAF